MPFVDIARCSDGTLYVGQTADLAVREDLHNQGLESKYTAKRLPVKIVYSEPHSSPSAAHARERQLKGWTAKKKEALIAGDRVTLKSLSKRRHR
jgi:putative endonuclease